MRSVPLYQVMYVFMYMYTYEKVSSHQANIGSMSMLRLLLFCLQTNELTCSMRERTTLIAKLFDTEMRMWKQKVPNEQASFRSMWKVKWLKPTSQLLPVAVPREVQVPPSIARIADTSQRMSKKVPDLLTSHLWRTRQTVKTPRRVRLTDFACNWA